MSTKTTTCIVVLCDGCSGAFNPCDDEMGEAHYSTAARVLSDLRDQVDSLGTAWEFTDDLSAVTCPTCVDARREAECAAAGGHRWYCPSWAPADSTVRECGHCGRHSLGDDEAGERR